MRRHWLALGLAGILAVSAFGCEFVFSHDRIVAPLGTWGEVGIRVYKTHTRCTLPSPDAYVITVQGAQVLAESPWRQVQPNVLEKWVVLSLAQVGSGYLKIAKTCTKEGYEEAVLPLEVTAPEPEGPWAQAMAGVYPLPLPSEGEVLTVAGEARLSAERLEIGGMTFLLPTTLPNLSLAEARLFYALLPGGEVRPLLLVAEGVFWRLDHLWP